MAGVQNSWSKGLYQDGAGLVYFKHGFYRFVMKRVPYSSFVGRVDDDEKKLDRKILG